MSHVLNQPAATPTTAEANPDAAWDALNTEQKLGMLRTVMKEMYLHLMRISAVVRELQKHAEAKIVVAHSFPGKP